MASLILPRRFTSQPQVSTQIDYKGLGRGLRGLWMPLDGRSKLLRNRVTGNTSIATSGTVTPDLDKYGRILNFNIGYIDTGEAIDIIGSEITIAIRFNVDPFAYRLFGNHGPGTTGYLAFLNTSSQIEFYVNAVQVAVGTTPRIAWTQAAFSASGGIKRVAVDGVVTETAGSVTLASQSLSVKLGAYNWDGFSNFTGLAEYFAVWDRGLTSPELRLFQANPYAIFQPSRRLIFSVPATGSTLTGAASTQTNAASTAGITQTHVLTGAASAQTNTGLSAGITQVHGLTGANVSQANIGSAGAITVIASVTLTGAASNQINAASTGTITQTGVLSGAASNQINTGSTAAISQVHALTGAAAAQSNLSSAGSVGALTGATSTQANASSQAAITQVQTLTGTNAAQANASSTAGITQTQVLSASACTQLGTSSAVAITQVHVLVGANGAQANLGISGAVTVSSGLLTGASAIQSNIGGTGTITRSLGTLIGAPASQYNLGNGVAIAQIGVVIEASKTTGIAPSTSIKKPGIPAGTDDWLKTTIEIIEGRRNNAITIPKAQTLTFSSTPTQAECNALYSYVNGIRDALDSLITRFDT